jgi:ATP-dependent RNA helicase DDX54/DBP10
LLAIQAAYLIPMLQRLQDHSTTVGIRAIIVVPTRELALQTSKFTADLAKFTDLRHAVVLGGESMNEQFSLLANNPDILIATPGRLIHVIELTKLSLARVQYVVFDEADQCFEMGLLDQVMQLVRLLPETRQTLLISATLPQALVEFSKVGLNDPSVIRLDVENTLSELLRMSFYVIRPEEKYAMLMHALNKVIPKGEQALVFVCTKYHCELLCKMAKLHGFSANYIFGEMDPTARKDSLGRFRSGEVRFCFVTDVAARGIDIPRLQNVINFDFPSRPKLFVHRVGRVARAGRPGKAISLLTPDEVAFMVDLHTFLGYDLRNAPDEWQEGDEYVEEPLKPCYGKVTTSLLETEVESVRNMFDNQGRESDELTSLNGVCTKAFKLYAKMRSNPSPAAIKQSKVLNASMDLHPTFKTKLSDTEKTQSEYVSFIHNFRAKSTIFELGKQNDIMKERRVIREHILDKEILMTLEGQDSVIQESKEETEEEKASETKTKKKKPKKAVKPIKTDFRDSSFFISTDMTDRASFKEGKLKVKDNGAKTLDDYTLDLDGDDADTLMRKKRQIRKWDPKKKKFVTEQLGAKRGEKKDKEKDENGQEKKKVNPYVQWKKQHRQMIPMAGSHEEADHINNDIVDKMRKAKNRFREYKNNGPELNDEEFKVGKKANNELKPAENILKTRKRKARDAERQTQLKAKKQRRK